MPSTRNRRDALLAAALEGFTHRGYDATSVAELAATTGMSKAAVSYHFRTKNDLLHALADPLLDSLDALAERHPRAPHWPGEVRALLDDYLTTLTDHSQIAAWVDSDKAVLNHPQIGARLHPAHRTDRPDRTVRPHRRDATRRPHRSCRRTAVRQTWVCVRSVAHRRGPGNGSWGARVGLALAHGVHPRWMR
jgi:AcrR family transcriptional regulator